MKIDIAKTADGRTISLPLNVANRHGLITGSTGGGKTVTLQRMAEEFSKAGIPVFAADIKGDLSGMAAKGDKSGKAEKRAKELKVTWKPDQFPVQFWDLFGDQGTPIRTSVTSIGPVMLSRMLGLNETQEGTLQIAFKKSHDEQAWMLTLDDLRWTLDEMQENREDVCKTYGNITAASINTIQRQLLSLEQQGGHHLFGERPFDINDMMRIWAGEPTAAGEQEVKGVINLLAADKLLESPKLYATFLLWMLNELFRTLPEVGDLDTPKLIFFFDEAHLLFRDAPAELVYQIEKTVRLVRSKGVGVYMVTQSPADIPDSVLAQLGSRIQHALRAYTPKDQRMVKAAAQSFRPNRSVDIKAEITKLSVGEALVSMLDEKGVPAIVEKALILPPCGHIGPIEAETRLALLQTSDLHPRYGLRLPEAEAALQFKNRMLRYFDLPELKPAGDWQPGDFKAFVPTQFQILTHGDDEHRRPGRIYSLQQILKGIGYLGAAVLILKIAIASV